MKLLFVTPYFYPQIGGLENYAYNIVKRLKHKYGWEVVVVTTNHVKREYREDIIEGIKIYRLPILFKVSNTPINPFWYFSIKKILLKEKPDLVNAHTPVPFIADIAARIVNNVPFVVTYHAGTMKKDKWFFDMIIRVYEGLFLHPLLNKADKIVCSSRFVKNSIAKKYISKCLIIYPGVDTDLFKPSNTRKGANTVLFVGCHANVYPLKGLYFLMDVMKQLPRLTLKVVGEKIHYSQSNVEFVGVKSGEALVKEIQTSSLLVLPSLFDMESFGMVLLEAMACKLPVIGTRVGGIPEVIDNDRDGILVSKNNSGELRNAINKIMNDSRLARKMGECGYSKVIDQFTWDRQTALTNDLFSRILL